MGVEALRRAGATAVAAIAVTLSLAVSVQGADQPTPRALALELVQLIHIGKACPAFMTIDQDLAGIMAKNILVRGYEEFGADRFDGIVGTVGEEFRTSLAAGRDDAWCREQREAYRARRRDGMFR